MTQQEGQAVFNILRDNIRDDYSEARPDRRVLPRRAVEQPAVSRRTE